MTTLAYLCLLLASFSALVSARPASSLSKATVYNNCSGDYTHHVPKGVDSTYYKAQVHVKPEDAPNNGSGWEEWLFIGHNALPDGEEMIYGYKFVWGDPTSGNYSHKAFIGFVNFPNGTAFRQIDHGVYDYKETSDGGFTVSVEKNSLTYDPVKNHWHASINAMGFVIDEYIENAEPFSPYEPNYQGKPGQIHKDFYSRMDAPRAYSKGALSLPWGDKYAIESVGSLKHTWSYESMQDAIAAYVRGSTFLPGVATVHWYQAWDNSGKEVDSVQFIAQPDADVDSQVFRYQATDVAKSLSIVTTPKPVGLPLSYKESEITLPLCGPGAGYKHGDKMTWKVNNLFNISDFVDFVGSHTLTQKVDITAHLWSDGKVVDVDGGFGLIEVYHRI